MQRVRDGVYDQEEPREDTPADTPFGTPRSHREVQGGESEDTAAEDKHKHQDQEEEEGVAGTQCPTTNLAPRGGDVNTLKALWIQLKHHKTCYRCGEPRQVGERTTSLRAYQCTMCQKVICPTCRNEAVGANRRRSRGSGSMAPGTPATPSRGRPQAPCEERGPAPGTPAAPTAPGTPGAPRTPARRLARTSQAPGIPAQVSEMVQSRQAKGAGGNEGSVDNGREDQHTRLC